MDIQIFVIEFIDQKETHTFMVTDIWQLCQDNSLEIFSSTNGLGHWISTWKGIKLDHYLTQYTKINSKWINGLNVRPKTITLLEDNMGINLHDLVLGNFFFFKIQHQKHKWKIDNLDINKINQKMLLRQWKDNSQNGKKCLQIISCDMGLICHIYKELFHLSNKKITKLKNRHRSE